MDIKVLGGGCPKCKKLAAVALSAAESVGLQVEIDKITDMNAIAEYGVAMTPALVINGEVKSAGKIPAKEEIAGWLQAAQ